ncbi:MAG TPA: sulfotransferase [Rhodanobacteraceae bacterium]|nr:sulfotransferase [Rhodanobacteraceae bacterium]
MARAETPPAGSRFADLPAPLREQLAFAVEALRGARADAARRTLRRVLASAPDHPEVLRLLGVAERLCGNDDAALAAFDRAAALRPDDALIQGSLGGALAAVDRGSEAVAAYRRACELAPGLAVTWNNLGKALSDAGRMDEAVAALERAIALAPELQAPRFSLAYARTISGETTAAAVAYREILERWPDDGEAWMGLARLKNASFDARDIDALRALLAGAGDADARRIPIAFALGHALQDHGEYAEAFTVFSIANAASRRRQPWDAAAFSARLDRILATSHAIADGDSAFGCEAIFIVGMPRSGTTLIEQVLAAHSGVDARGELPALSMILREESQRRAAPYPEWAAAMTPQSWRSLGERYLERARGGAHDARHFTDKLPGNWLYLGPIRAMLPGARIVVCRRDPLETCWSCFRHRFAEGRQAFAYDLDDIAAWWRDFDRASRHWIARAPAHVREQHHERLLDRPETEVRALLAFCGLAFEPACLRPHTAARPVRTLSASQVRQPLLRDTAIAARYGAVLDPLRRALEAHAQPPRNV